MKDFRNRLRESSFPIRWITRLLSIMVSGVFLLMVFLAITNEDRPQFGLGTLGLLSAIFYSAPFLVLGILFWVCGQTPADGSSQDAAPISSVLRWWVFIGGLGALALTACGPETLVVGLEPTTLQKHDSPVQSVAFSPDGALLAAGSQDGTVRIWRAADSRITDWPLLHVRKISISERRDSHSYDVAFSPDGRTLAFGLPDGSVRLWRLSADSGGGQHPSDLQVTSLHTLRVEESKICSLDFAPDGRMVVAGAGNGSVHLWRVTDGTQLWSLNGHTNDVVSVAFSPDGTVLASTSLDGPTKLWDTSNATLIHELETPAASIAFSPDGSMLATAGAADGQRRLWSTNDWTPIRELESARGGLGNVAFSPDGRLLAAGNAWHEVRWWRVADGALLHTIRGHTDSVNSVTFPPDGQTLASGSLDGTVKLWRVP